jgi:TPR repeat protein
MRRVCGPRNRKPDPESLFIIFIIEGDGRHAKQNGSIHHSNQTFAWSRKADSIFLRHPNGGRQMICKSISPAAVLALLLGGVSAFGQSTSSWFPVARWSSSQLNCPSDSDKAALIRNAAKGDTAAQDRLGTLKISSCKGMHDAVGGVKLLNLAAEKGNTHAQLALGDAYRFGILGKVDYQKAVSWFRRAALQDDARAQNDYGMAFYLGLGVPRSAANAAKMFRLAAQQNLHEAAYNLGTLYDRGQGVETNYPRAIQWYFKAAEQHDGAAEYRLGILSRQGLGMAKDEEAAAQWFDKALQHGSVEAMVRFSEQPSPDNPASSYYLYMAGTALLSGQGVPKNEAKARAALLKAAEQKFSPAYFQLARIYSDGLGVSKSEAKAIEYYEMVVAADRTDAVAYNNIAWVRVTSSDPKIRDPQKALEYALKAVQLSGGDQAYAVDTLANAYFQVGQIDKAIAAETHALALEPEDETYSKTLASFKNSKDRALAGK